MNLSPNENAPSFVFPEDEEEGSGKRVIPEGSHWENVSLDFLFPDLNFSEKFCSTEAFRRELRDSMREDVFDSTPAYRGEWNFFFTFCSWFASISSSNMRVCSALCIKCLIRRDVREGPKNVAVA